MLLRGLLLFILFWVIARAFWRLIDGVVKGATGQAAARGGRARQGAVGVKMAPCPVCGTYVVPGKAIRMTSGGTTVYFCSDACRAAYLPS